MNEKTLKQINRVLMLNEMVEEAINTYKKEVADYKKWQQENPKKHNWEWPFIKL